MGSHLSLPLIDLVVALSLSLSSSHPLRDGSNCSSLVHHDINVAPKVYPCYHFFSLAGLPMVFLSLNRRFFSTLRAI